MDDHLSIVEKARAFAVERHKDQMYGSEQVSHPYEWHLEKVAALAEKLGYPEPIQAAAWLHDVVEDTPTTIDEIRTLFGDKIAEIVENVTYSDGDKAAGVDKIDKARQNKGAHVVKFCDSSINFSASALYGPPGSMNQWQATVERYSLFITQLRVGLPTPQEIEEWLKEP